MSDPLRGAQCEAFPSRREFQSRSLRLSQDIRKLWVRIGMCFFVLPICNVTWANEFVSESTSEFTIKVKGTLDITNAIGDITVKGWALDKVRVKVRKTVEAKDKAEANQKFEAVSYRYRHSETGVELTSQYGDGLTIEDRMRQKNTQGKVKLSFVVFAPAKMTARVWGLSGDLEIRNWNSDVYLRLKRGRIEADTVSANQVSAVCPDCDVTLKNIRGSIRCTGEHGVTRILNAEGPSIFAETDTGALFLDQAEGGLTLLSRNGDIKGEHLSGDIDFRTLKSKVVMRDVRGSVSGSSLEGSISIGISRWDSAEKSAIETVSGKIEVTLPAEFSANVDFSTEHGNLASSFPIEADESTDTAFVAGQKHAKGRVRDGGGLFSLSSKTGDVIVIKGEF